MFNNNYEIPLLIGLYYKPRTLGFESMLQDIEKLLGNQMKVDTNNTFPPHNIIQVDDNHYLIELAIAGFTEKEIDITVDNGILTIKGEKIKSENVLEPNYLYHGIATRSFSKSIRLADTIEVQNAEYENGILKIELENVKPENTKPLKITVKTVK